MRISSHEKGEEGRGKLKNMTCKMALTRSWKVEDGGTLNGKLVEYGRNFKMQFSSERKRRKVFNPTLCDVSYMPNIYFIYTQIQSVTEGFRPHTLPQQNFLPSLLLFPFCCSIFIFVYKHTTKYVHRISDFFIPLHFSSSSSSLS